MRRALRTLVAMNLEVTWMAVRSKVRSPVAAWPRRSWSCRTCLGEDEMRLSLGRACLSVPGQRDEVGVGEVLCGAGHCVWTVGVSGGLYVGTDGNGLGLECPVGDEEGPLCLTLRNMLQLRPLYEIIPKCTLAAY